MPKARERMDFVGRLHSSACSPPASRPSTSVLRLRSFPPSVRVSRSDGYDSIASAMLPRPVRPVSSARCRSCWNGPAPSSANAVSRRTRTASAGEKIRSMGSGAWAGCGAPCAPDEADGPGGGEDAGVGVGRADGCGASPGDMDTLHPTPAGPSMR
jgi:hypothetical protein